MPDRSQPLGKEDLEAGIRPTKARDFAVIAGIVVAMLLVSNSRSLVEWTRQPQPGPGIAALEAPAVAWHDWMIRLGPARQFEKLRQIIQRHLAE
jgi:hypothetical protein